MSFSFSVFSVYCNICVSRLTKYKYYSHFARTSHMAPLRIGLFGGGTVGGGVVELLNAHKQRFAKLNISVQIVKICVRDLKKTRNFSTEGITLVDNYDEILKDNSIQCVIEVIGGITDAKDVVFNALKAKKHVITANKALVAAYCDELAVLVRENNVFFGYEAAVCGGIPIIDILQNAYIGDTIWQVSGIINGTTNYMLTKMEEGADYAAVLKEAQDLGYAEADPAADVDGLDVQAKIALCAKLCFGHTVDLKDVKTQGIRSVSKVDFEYAKLLKCTIKMLGVSRVDNGKLITFVSPCLVPETSPLGGTRLCANVIVIESTNMGIAGYTGPGAGRFPTANSVVSDVIRAARHMDVAPTDPFPLKDQLVVERDISARFYVRIKVKDCLGIVKAVGIAAENAGLSIDSILQNPIADRNNMDFVVILETCEQLKVDRFCVDLNKQPFTLELPFSMPIM